MKNTGARHTRDVSIAKQYATDAAFNAAHDAIEVHGAYGYSAEYPVERFLRNARAPIIYEGTREVHTILQGEYALGYREDKPDALWLVEIKRRFGAVRDLVVDETVI
jgi:glutaryl-CoA dehydrogenase (non-decarboxylating)